MLINNTNYSLSLMLAHVDYNLQELGTTQLYPCCSILITGHVIIIQSLPNSKISNIMLYLLSLSKIMIRVKSHFIPFGILTNATMFVIINYVLDDKDRVVNMLLYYKLGDD